MLRVIEYVWGTLGPLSMVGAAIWLFVSLLARARRGRIARVKAALIFLPTVLLPVIFFYVLWFIADFANSFETPRSIWNGDAAPTAFLITGILFALIAVLNVILWGALFFFSQARPDGSAT